MNWEVRMFTSRTRLALSLVLVGAAAVVAVSLALPSIRRCGLDFWNYEAEIESYDLERQRTSDLDLEFEHQSALHQKCFSVTRELAMRRSTLVEAVETLLAMVQRNPVFDEKTLKPWTNSVVCMIESDRFPLSVSIMRSSPKAWKSQEFVIAAFAISRMELMLAHAQETGDVDMSRMLQNRLDELMDELRYLSFGT
jgi:hypothetical protein